MLSYARGNIPMNNQDSHHKTSKDSFVQCLKGNMADRVLLFSLLLGTLLLWFAISKQLSAGPATVYIYHQQQLLAKYPLPTDDKVIHVAALGEIGESNVEISKQGIRFISSPCTTHYCTLSGHKSHAGSIIACVPNHIMVVLRGSCQSGDENNHFDAISE